LQVLREAIQARIKGQELSDDPLATQLAELLEDVDDYITHVWSL